VHPSLGGRAPVIQWPVFGLLALAMLTLFALSWPIEMSLDLWVFKDRGSFLNLDYLLDQHLRLGVDTYYAYGLLPVLVQHVLFAAFGRGPLPLIGLHFLYVLLMAGAWAMILQRLPDRRFWLLSAVAMVPIIAWVNPNLPYVLVQLSLLFSIALVLAGRFSLALAVSAIGCWSVPTVTLLFSGLVLGLIAFDWWKRGDRSWYALARAIVPGALAYALIGLSLAAIFGWRSVLATALPTQGMSFYKAVDFGMFTTLKIFLFPDAAQLPHGSALRYYVFDRATWWMLSTLLLVIFTAHGAVRLLKERQMRPAYAAVVLCGAVQLSFAVLAYGTPPQHIIYDPILLAGAVIGLAGLSQGKLRYALIGICIGTGVLSQVNQAAYTYSVWKATRPALADKLYTSEAFTADWAPIAALAKTQRVLVLSYSTGIHHYFPNVDSADAWTLQAGQLFESDRRRLFTKIREAQFIAEDLTGVTSLFERDPDIRRELASLCLVEANSSFLVWTRAPAEESSSAPATAGLGHCVSDAGGRHQNF